MAPHIKSQWPPDTVAPGARWRPISRANRPLEPEKFLNQQSMRPLWKTLGPLEVTGATDQNPMGPYSKRESLNQEPTQSLWRRPWGHWSQLGPQIKCPMEQVAAQDKKLIGPLNQTPIRLLWIPWTPGATEDPRGRATGAFGDLWRSWGSNLEVTGSPVAIWVRSQVKLFPKIFRFFCS